MLDEITSVADIVGALGVILSLLYVGKQLKQTNTMSRSSVHVARGDAMVTWATSVACSPPLCETLAKVHYHDLVRENAAELERMQLGYLFVGLAGQIHMGFEQWKEGVITRNELEEVSGPASPLLSQRYLASVWPILKLGYPADFQDWFEKQYGLVDG